MHRDKTVLGEHCSLTLFLDDLCDLRGKTGGDDEIAQPLPGM